MYTVQVMIPNHRDEPGKVIAQYVFAHKSKAEEYASSVNAHPAGAYKANVLQGDLGSFDITVDPAEDK